MLAPLAANAVVGTTSQVLPAAALADSWSAVGKMNGASAVAVGPHLVLTAGHVGAGNFVLGTTTYHMTDSEAGPKVGKIATDLCLVTLKETLPTWYSIGTTIKKGATVSMVGFGGSGVVNTAGTGYTLNSWGSKHNATNNVSSLETTSGRGPTMRAMLDGAGDGVLAGGDSGGGWFSGGKLVGISDFTFSNDLSRPDYGFSGRAYFGSGAIDLTNKTLHAWLTGEISGDVEESALLRGVSAHVNPVPEPSALLGLGLGAGVLLRRKKR